MGITIEGNKVTLKVEGVLEGTELGLLDTYLRWAKRRERDGMGTIQFIDWTNKEIVFILKEGRRWMG